MMNNEDFERKVEFIVSQQAQFAANIQQLQEAQAVTEQKVARAEEAAARASEAAVQASEAAVITAEAVANLANVSLEGFRTMAEGFKDVNVKLDALVDSQILTDEKLRDLIAVVDRHISDGHNGVNN